MIVTARNQTAAVIGAGDFIGAAIAKKLAAEGFTLFVGRRNGYKLAPLVKEIEVGGGNVFGRSLDARNEEEIVSFLSDADKQAPLEVCVFNIGANVNLPLVDTTERGFRKVWEMACYSGFLAGRTAVAQAAARELWPKNIHVAHLIIDSGVDTEWVRERIKEREGQAALDNLDPDRLMPPTAVAEAYWQLYQQPRSAWVFEQEIRPFGEKW